MTPQDLEDASRTLAEREPPIAALYERIGPCRLGPRQPSHFLALARSIVFQQLAGAAARTIWGRVDACFEGRPTAETTLAMDEAPLRAAGLSANKLAALKDLAAKTTDGTVPLHTIARLEDHEIVDRLVTVRGIGPWTAQMFLLFQLRRPDVWPTGDLGVRKGYAALYELEALPSPADLEGAGDRFRPYRSIAAWYCWRAVETVTL